MNASQKDLGAAVRGLRNRRKMTIEGLAERSDMHFTYLSGIERGVRNPTWSKLNSLATGLGIVLAEIVTAAEAEAKLAARMREVRQELGMSDEVVVVDDADGGPE
jgi:transcriptional regulator with XRE-family HTH domain